MDINKMTVKTQEAIQAAQDKATRLGHVEIDGEHLLAALLEQADGLTPRLLQKLGVDSDTFSRALKKDLEKRPSVSGGGVEAGKIYVSQRFNRLLVKAEEEARHLKDEYISVEHLLLAMVDEGTSSPAGRLFREFKITRA